MSIFMFPNTGQTPVAQAIAGAVSKGGPDPIVPGRGSLALLVRV